MEAQIRYVKTNDGVNIAYLAIGSGVPVVVIDMPCSNLRYEWEQPFLRAGYEATARVATFVRFDHRAFGLSDQFDGSPSTDHYVEDLRAVVDKLAFDRFFLVASRGDTYPIALHFAKLYPRRVIRLAAIVNELPQDFIEAMMDTPGADWHFITEALSRKIFGWDDEDASRHVAEFLRASTDLPRMRQWMTWTVSARPPADMSDIDVPTLFLVAHDRDHAIVKAREMSSGMPDAHVELYGEQAIGMEGRSLPLMDAVSHFFGGATLLARGEQPVAPSGTAVILFADIAESTALTELLGDAAFREKARALEGALRSVVGANGGSMVEGKLLGDGVLATFGGAAAAIAAGLQYGAEAERVGLGLHVGLHAGDVLREQGNVFGGAVNIAARISALAAPGEVLVSRTVADLARTSASVTFEDRGEHALKGIAEPQRVFAVRPL